MYEDLLKTRRRYRLFCYLLVVLLVISISSFLFIRYINRSTPDKTLDNFCAALLRGDYRSAYSQFSPHLQQSIAEATFAAPIERDRVTACTHGTTSDVGVSVVNEIKLVHASQGRNDDVVTLVKDSNDAWKIDDISRRSG